MKESTLREGLPGHQAPLPQGREAAGGCNPRHGRGDRKKLRSSSELCSILIRLYRIVDLLPPQPAVEKFLSSAEEAEI